MSPACRRFSGKIAVNAAASRCNHRHLTYDDERTLHCTQLPRHAAVPSRRCVAVPLRGVRDDDGASRCWRGKQDGRAVVVPSASLASSSSTGNQLSYGTSGQERSRSVSPPCFGARAEETKQRRRTKRRFLAARSAKATDGSVSSTSVSSNSSPLSSLGGRLGLTTSPERRSSASPPCFRAHGGGSALARSPEKEKGGVVGSYLHRISRTLRWSATADDESSPRTTIARSALLIGEGRRNGGSVIATEDEIRALVMAYRSHTNPLI
ncbi:hypothetical protein ABZP36_031022 [Zizania latifolia]